MSPRRPSLRPDVVLGLLVGLSALAAHFAFSALGFNPTDDGFILATSRRLLDGQVPHRDFISIRPVGSGLLHAPSVLLGGESAFWVARLVVWCEFALVAWAWVHILRGPPRRWRDVLEAWCLVLVALMLPAHTFPIMPWHTVDGLALASLGLVLATSPGARRRLLGFALIGFAGLCKQNFLLLAPLSIVVLGRHRSWTAWLAAVAPWLVYAGALVITGAARDALVQLDAQTDLAGSGVLPYLTSPYLCAGLLLGYGMAALSHMRPPKKGRARLGAPHAAALLLAGGALLGAGATMGRSDYFYLNDASFLIFGLSAGAVGHRLRPLGWRDPGTRVGFLALAVVWSASVSLGYRTPALGIGALAVYLLTTVMMPYYKLEELRGGVSRLPVATAATLALGLALLWVPARLANVYLDRPARELAHPLDGLLPGGRHLRTNANTYAMFVDLERAVGMCHGHPYAILPDFCGYWAESSQRNPLPIDWPESVELNRPALVQRVETALARLRGHGRVIVQKVYARNLARGFYALDSENAYYVVVGYVRGGFQKVGETRWFEIYE